MMKQQFKVVASTPKARGLMSRFIGENRLTKAGTAYRV